MILTRNTLLGGWRDPGFGHHIEQSILNSRGKRAGACSTAPPSLSVGVLSTVFTSASADAMTNATSPKILDSTNVHAQLAGPSRVGYPALPRWQQKARALNAARVLGAATVGDPACTTKSSAERVLVGVREGTDVFWEADKTAHRGGYVRRGGRRQEGGSGEEEQGEEPEAREVGQHLAIPFRAGR